MFTSLFIYRQFTGRLTKSYIPATDTLGRSNGAGAGGKRETTENEQQQGTFAQALRKQADDQGVIILASVDSGYIDMALNFYESSLKKLGLSNYLFVTSDSGAFKALSQRGIASFNYFDDKDAKKSSNYASAAFARKTHYKTKIVLEALKLGLTVLISDVDIVLFQNPFPFMPCRECDLQITSDKRIGNSGFYLVRPTPGGIELHQKAWDNAKAKPNISNQKQLNKVAKKLQSEKKLKSCTLSLKQFPCGQTYFEEQHRMFAGDNPCKECVMVHDNWIVGGKAKIYRLKEHLLWYVDTDGYYSDKNRQYIAYENALDFGGKTAEYEAEALKSALSIGHLLNRTVILPAFHCKGCQFEVCKSPSKRCAFNANYHVANFDKAFQDAYREHVFLRHELVPKEVKQSQSGLILIDSALTDKRLKSESGLVHFKPADIRKGASSAEILSWFDTDAYSGISVLRFHSLYDSFSGKLDEPFNSKLTTCLKKSSYRQYQ